MFHNLYAEKCRCSLMDAHRFQRFFAIWLLIFLIIEQVPQSVATTNIDMTTEYNLETSSSSNSGIGIGSSSSSSNTSSTIKSSKSALHNRFPKSQMNSLPTTKAPAMSISSTATTLNKDDNIAEEPQHLLVSMSSKSYITAPTTAASKLMKRAGTLAELKPRNAAKLLKDNLRQNRTRDVEGRNRSPGDVSDHIPDSSGHVPYRIGRPLLAPLPPSNRDYGNVADGPIISVNEAGDDDPPAGDTYHSVPYESEKWQNNEYWEHDYDKNLSHNTTRVQHIEAECQDDYMKIRIGFNGSFNGLLYSAGYAYDPDCMYINGSGRDYYEFYIQLNRCGTLGKNALHDESRKNPTNFMWNTVTVQYNPMIEEEYDEHFKVTCEYGYDFWKTVTFPFLDVEVATGNPVVFTLSPPECYMEIQNGYGIGGPRVTGPVRVGDPLTLIIFMRSKYDGFDIVVNDCYAHNGANKRIQLIDEYGCPVDDKLISRFRGSWSDSGVFETQVYAYMKTFRFTGSPALYIECDVRMCHGRCPSQPCHWRNLKAVTKRDISNANTTYAAKGNELTSAAASEKSETKLSENVNLFQSLHVLQEGESDDVDDVYSPRQRHTGINAAQQTCLKTSTLTALMATGGMLLSIVCAALIVSCSRLKQRSKEAMHYSNYITHKGQID